MSSTCFGLHIGNSSACIAVQRDGRVDVVANDAGHRVTPTSVGWNEQELLTGLSAKQFAGRAPTSIVVRGNKAVMGRRSDDETVQTVAGQSGKDTARVLVDAQEPAYEIPIPSEGRTKRVAPREVHTHILGYMHDIAVSHATAETEDKNTVITVPLNFTAEQRRTCADCAKKAGFNVVQVISEPAAACLAYGLGQLDTTERFHALVYRIGGLSLTCSVVLVHGGYYSVIGTVNKLTGGDGVTRILSDYLAGEFQRKYRCDPRESKRSKQKLFTNAENVKHILSTLDTANCYVESLHEGIDFNCNVTRARFENEMGKILSDFLTPIHNVLEQTGLSPDDISKVILCGGTAKIPKIQKSVSGILKKAEVLSSLSADEVIALGAATQASLVDEDSIKTGEETSPEVPVSKYALMFRSSVSDSLETLIPSDCPIPVRKSAALPKAKAGEELSVTLFVQAPGVKDEDAKEIAKLHLTDVTEESKLSVSAHIHRDGSVHFVLTDKNASKSDQITLGPAKK